MKPFICTAVPFMAMIVVQPLLDCKADPGADIHAPVAGRRANVDEFRLRGKHFAESCHKKPPTIVENVTSLSVKAALKPSIPKVNCK